MPRLNKNTKKRPIRDTDEETASRLPGFLWSRGDRIRELRESAGLTQTDLATDCDTSQRCISDAENERGETKTATLQRIASVLGTAIDEIAETQAFSDKPKNNVQIAFNNLIRFSLDLLDNGTENIGLSGLKEVVEHGAECSPLLYPYRALSEQDKRFVWRIFEEDDITKMVFGSDGNEQRIIEEWFLAVPMYHEFKSRLHGRIVDMFLGFDHGARWTEKEKPAFIEKLQTRFSYLQSLDFKELEHVDDFVDGLISFDLAFASLCGVGGSWISMYMRPIRSYFRFSLLLSENFRQYERISRFLHSLFVVEREDELWAFSQFAKAQIPQEHIVNWSRNRTDTLGLYADGSVCLSLDNLLERWNRQFPNENTSAEVLLKHWNPDPSSPSMAAFAQELWDYIVQRPIIDSDNLD